jgi:hypothetical protein
VGEEERDADRRFTGRREPLVREEERRPKLEALLFQLADELARARLELRAADADAEIADAEVEEVVVRELFPGDPSSRTGQGALLPRSTGAAGRGC